MPIRAKMDSLSKDDFIKILSDTSYNLLLQTIELLKIEGLKLIFTECAIDTIAEISVELNEEDNIGARRLRTVIEAVMEDINFEAIEIVQELNDMMI